MTRAELRALHQLARWHGVQTQYRDVSQREVKASPQSLTAVLAALGVNLAEGNAREWLRAGVGAHWRSPLEPVVVAWQDRAGCLELRLPRSHPLPQVRLSCELESGERRALSLSGATVSGGVRLDGTDYIRWRVPLPAGLPIGYGKLELESRMGSFQARLICAPGRAWAPAQPMRAWGVFLPLYAMHNRGTWGAGDYSALGELLDWTVQQGGTMISTLPLLPLFLPADSSPYAPISKLFWNEFYVDVPSVPEWSQCAAARRRAPASRLAGLRRAHLVDYAGVYAIKRSALEAMARFFFSKPSARREQFQPWARGEVRRYAAFRAVIEARGLTWPHWPERLRQGDLKPGDYDTRVFEYHLYAQWIAQDQMAQLGARSRAAGARLYLDMPVGVHGEGYDVWRDQDLFALGASGGAPPDEVFTRGQDWGFAPLHPARLRAQGYEYVIAYLRHHLQHAGALRFDHVMGLHRLYWVPRGQPASHGAYVSYAAEELYALLCLESHRHRSLIVGENLGTVPPAVNRQMRAHGIRQMYVVQYEVRPDPKRPLPSPPVAAVASLNTHDMPPFASYWKGLDVADRLDLRLLGKNELGAERRRRRQINQALRKFLQRRAGLQRGGNTAAVLRACLKFLSASRVEWVLLNLEDLWQELRPQNTPGTILERVNWRVKAKYGLEDLASRPEVLAAVKTVRGMRPARKNQ